MNLPVYAIQKQLTESLAGKACGRVLLKAPTGSGKSTAVPQMLCDDGVVVDGMIVVVQPRRIAARMLARRVAALRGGKVGDEVGYVVRFDKKMGSSTKIVFVTDGVLEAWLADGALSGVGAVIFDEFHERRLSSDVALAQCLNLQDEGRPELKVVVMSATLEMAGLARYLDPCVVLEAHGRAFPVEVIYRAQPVVTRGAMRQQERVWDLCASAVKELMDRGQEGHVLVFLPGMYEIQRTIELLERASWAKGWRICPLYSALSPERQDEAVAAVGAPRIIVSTNVAETSLTIDGVTAVVDAGLARISEYDAQRGMDTLMVKKISRAAADQRAGRAGRTAPGRCIRLWSEADHGRRDAFELPEVRRADLTEPVLHLLARGVEDVAGFRWFEPPLDDALAHALDLLTVLGALDADGRLTEVGREMAKVRMHPRFARLLLVAEIEGCLAEAAFVAASVQGEGLFLRKGEGRKSFSYDDDGSDFEAEWRAYVSAREMNFDPRRCSQIGVSANGAREIYQVLEQVRQWCSGRRKVWSEVDFLASRTALSRAVLTAFSDQLAVRMGLGNTTCRLVGGRRGKLDAESVVKQAAAFVVTELTEVDGKEVTVHLSRCVAIDLDHLRDMFPHHFFEKQEAIYDDTIRRVVNRQLMCFRDLVIRQKDTGEPDADMAAQLLAQRVASGELKLKKWDDEVEQWIARLLSLREWMPELELPGFDEEDRAIAFEQICEGALGYKDIKDREVMPALLGWLSFGQLSALDVYAPSRISLANGQSVKVKYEVGQLPSIALQVQRLFGVDRSPTIADGRVTIQVHVCAPNQRPWQMTQDLASFWNNGFAQMKKDLAGRYPKHRWEL